MNLITAFLLIIALALPTYVGAEAIDPKTIEAGSDDCAFAEYGVCVKASFNAGGLLPQIKTCENAVTQAAMVYDESIKQGHQDLTTHGISLDTLVNGYITLHFAKKGADALSQIPNAVELLEGKKAALEKDQRMYEIARKSGKGHEATIAKKLGRVQQELLDVSGKLERIAKLRAQFPAEKTIDGLISRAVKSHPNLMDTQKEVGNRIAHLTKVIERLGGNSKYRQIRSKTIATLSSELRSLNHVNQALTKIIQSSSQGYLKNLWTNFLKSGVKNEALFTMVSFLSNKERQILVTFMRKNFARQFFGKTFGLITGGFFGTVLGEFAIPEIVSAPGIEHTMDLYTKNPHLMFKAIREGVTKPAEICDYATDPMFADSLDRVMTLVSDYGTTTGRLTSPLPQISHLLADAPVKDPADILFSSEFDMEESGPEIPATSGTSQ